MPYPGIQNSCDPTTPAASHLGADYRSELKDIAPLLNYICDELWKRDQILAAGAAATQGSAPGVGVGAYL